MTNWQQIRQQVLERDNYICKECGQSLKSLEVHHKLPKRKGGLDILDNLISLCRKCHKTIEPTRKMGYPNKVNCGIMFIKVTDDVHKRLKKRIEWGQPLTEIIEELLNLVENKAVKKWLTGILFFFLAFLDYRI